MADSVMPPAVVHQPWCDVANHEIPPAYEPGLDGFAWELDPCYSVIVTVGESQMWLRRPVGEGETTLMIDGISHRLDDAMRLADGVQAAVTTLAVIA